MFIKEEYKDLTSSEFATKVAKVMKDLSSSHVYFILQQAFGDDLDWSEAEYILDKFIAKAKGGNGD